MPWPMPQNASGRPNGGTGGGPSNLARTGERLLQPLDPGSVPGALVVVNPEGVRVLQVEETGPRGHARRGSAVALIEAHPFRDQAVKMGCVHVRKTQGTDRVVALLICHEENDIGLFHGLLTRSRPPETDVANFYA